MAQLRNTTINTNGAFTLPTGNPGSPQTGMIRYNSSSNELEFYSNGRWNPVTTPDSSGGVISTVDVGTNTFNVHTFFAGTDTFTRE